MIEEVRRSCRIKKYGVEVVDLSSRGSTPDEARRGLWGQKARVDKDLLCLSDSEDDFGTA